MIISRRFSTNDGGKKRNGFSQELFENPFLNIPGNKSQLQTCEGEERTTGEITVFIPERHLSVDQVILQGEE